MKYHFCITICGELDSDTTPIPPEPGEPPYIDNRPPQIPIIDAGFPTTPPGGRPQWPVDPGYGIEVPPGQEGGPPQIDNTLPGRGPGDPPYIDAGFPITPPGGRPQPPEPPTEGQPPQIDNTLPGNLPGSPPHIDADFPITQPPFPEKPCEPSPKAVSRAVSQVVSLRKVRGIHIESLNTVVSSMNSRRKD